MRRSEQTRGPDGAIAELADRQHGVVTRWQLRGIGLSDDAVNRRLRAGRLYVVHPGVFAVGRRGLSRQGHWMAAVLACGPGAALSHRAAAAHWGFRGHSGSHVDVTSPRKTRSRGSIRRHWARLRPDEATVHDDIPITTVPRTILDLAGESTPQAIESALRRCEYLRLYDSLSLWDLLGRYPRHRGNAAIRTALARLGEAPGEVEEGLEERFLSFLDARRLPRPHLNRWLEAQGHRYRVDCLWPAAKLIVELDSWQAHGTRSAFRSDRARARRLEAAGYRVSHVTRHQLDHEGEELADDLRALLGAVPAAVNAPVPGLR